MDDRVQSILSRLQGAAQQAGQSATAAAQQTGLRVGVALDITKVNVQIHELNKEIAILLKGAGRIVYDAHLGIETDEAMLNSILSQLDEKYAQVADLRVKVDALKDLRICPNCGNSCKPGDHHCKHCGAVLN